MENVQLRWIDIEDGWEQDDYDDIEDEYDTFSVGFVTGWLGSEG